MFSKICFVGLILGVVFSGLYVAIPLQDKKEKYAVSTEGLQIPEFTEIQVDFTHVYSEFSSLPFMAAAVIDVDNDGKEELFLGGGRRQPDGLFRFSDNRFSNISERVGLVKMGGGETLSARVLDADNNGFNDLLVTRTTGVWLYLNNNGKLTGTRLKVPIDSKSVPLSVAVADINKDGHFDMFVSGYPKKQTLLGPFFADPEANDSSMLLLNGGDNTFSDITRSIGDSLVLDSMQAIWADLDSDGLLDLTTINSVGGVGVWKNRGDLQFAKIQALNPLEKTYCQAGAVGDFDGDGAIDLFFSNVGSTMPEYIGNRTITTNQYYNPHWVLLKNRGDLQFENVATSSKLAGYELGRGAILVDLNLDGRNDLVVTENHPRWPLHWFSGLRLPGRVLLQNTKGEFAEIGTRVGVENSEYGVAPLIADFNEDGYADIVFANVNAKPKVYLSKGGKNMYVKVHLPNQVSSFGTTVKVTTLSGKSIEKQYISGQGLCSSSSPSLVFGLENDTAIEVMVTYPDKESKSTSGELFNTTVSF